MRRVRFQAGGGELRQALALLAGEGAVPPGFAAWSELRELLGEFLPAMVTRAAELNDERAGGEQSIGESIRGAGTLEDRHKVVSPPVQMRQPVKRCRRPQKATMLDGSTRVVAFFDRFEQIERQHTISRFSACDPARAKFAARHQAAYLQFRRIGGKATFEQYIQTAERREQSRRKKAMR